MPGIRRVQRPLHPTDGFWRGLRQSWRTRRGRCEWPLQGKWRLFRVSAPLLVAVGQLLLLLQFLFMKHGNHFRQDAKLIEGALEAYR